MEDTFVLLDLLNGDPEGVCVAPATELPEVIVTPRGLVAASQNDQDVILLEEGEIVPPGGQRGKWLEHSSKSISLKNSKSNETPYLDTSNLGIPLEVILFPRAPSIPLTPVHLDEAHSQLRLARHNFVVDEHTKGSA
uniref:Uncharacterized protein n=1 Tax=Cannabis sativa TaxID=3483 RepID=A0A803QSA7_CANSA